MKFLILLLFFTGCAAPQPKPNNPTSYRERISKHIENCMLRLADKGVEEKLLYQLCSKAHRPLRSKYLKVKKK